MQEAYTKNGHPATGSRLASLDRETLRSLAWPEPDEDKNRVAYDRRFLRLFGTDAGLLLSQLVFWTGKGHDPEGWIYKTIDEIIEEVGLDSRYAVDQARKKLGDEGEGVLEEEYRARKRWKDGENRTIQNSGVIHYRVRLAALAEKLGFDDRNVLDHPIMDELVDVDFDDLPD